MLDDVPAANAYQPRTTEIPQRDIRIPRIDEQDAIVAGHAVGDAKIPRVASSQLWVSFASPDEGPRTTRVGGINHGILEMSADHGGDTWNQPDTIFSKERRTRVRFGSRLQQT
jgi:hypothetical protein